MQFRNQKIKIIYDEILNFCKDKGLLAELNKSLEVPESDRFELKDIDKFGLDSIDAVHCLIDKNRTVLLANEILSNTKKESLVIEAGIGTGILSIVGSIRADKVFGYEINKEVYKLAKQIKECVVAKGLIKDNIFYYLNDARKVKFKSKVDLIISENLYTGMFFEKQIQIVRSLKKNLKKDGIFIPSGIKSSFTLLEANSKLNNKFKKLYVVSENEINFSRLSDNIVYDNIKFKTINRNKLFFCDKILIKKSGLVNSILINSIVTLPSGKVIGRKDTKFMNNDIVLMINSPLVVKRGDMVKVLIKYSYGSDPKNARIILDIT